MGVWAEKPLHASPMRHSGKGDWMLRGWQLSNISCWMTQTSQKCQIVFIQSANEKPNRLGICVSRHTPPVQLAGWSKVGCCYRWVLEGDTINWVMRSAKACKTMYKHQNFNPYVIIWWSKVSRYGRGAGRPEWLITLQAIRKYYLIRFDVRKHKNVFASGN